VRAEELARVLGDIDVVQGLDAILVAPGPAARETAAPVARRANLTIEESAMDDPEALAARILRDYKGLVVLVVTDGPVIPRLIPEFQGSKKVPEMAANEFDDIYVVSVPWYGKVKTLRLRYGSRPGALLPPG
jgi:broad specificity phosphatase PhoE